VDGASRRRHAVPQGALKAVPSERLGLRQNL